MGSDPPLDAEAIDQRGESQSNVQVEVPNVLRVFTMLVLAFNQAIGLNTIGARPVLLTSGGCLLVSPCRTLRCLRPMLGQLLQNCTSDKYAVHYQAIVPTTVAPGTRLPEVLVATDPERFPTMSQARKACRSGAVLVNGVRGNCIATAGGGDTIGLQTRVKATMPPSGTATFGVDVLYEDSELAVVFKPEGVCTFPPTRNKEAANASHGNTMKTAIKFALQPPAIGTLNVFQSPHIVHRLDRLTSGLLLCAKTRTSRDFLKDGFARREIHKQYRAIVCGHVEGDQGKIDATIGGRSAVTKWRVLSRARSVRLGDGHLTELALFPLTGRTHQLRRHCREALFAPIVGDLAYGGKSVDVGSGLFLSAVELSFRHPDRTASDEPMHIHVDAPTKFAKLLLQEQLQWEQRHAGDISGEKQLA